MIMQKLYHTDRLMLASLDPPAAPLVLDYLLRNREDFEQFEPPKEDSFYTVARQEAVLQAEQTLFERGQGLRYYIFNISDPDTIIGNVSFSHTDQAVCILGYRMDRDYRRLGLAYEAASYLIPLIFEHYGPSMIEADIYPENKASTALALKLGLKPSGTTTFMKRVLHRYVAFPTDT